jgi:signal transduction histidine kinase
MGTLVEDSLMNPRDFRGLDLNVARARIALSLLATVSLYIDPTAAGGLFRLNRWAFATLACHLIYSIAVYVALSRRPAMFSLATVSTMLDLLFATAVAFVAEGQTSPSYVFFVFAIIAAGIRPSLRVAIAVTVSSVILYLLIIALSDRMTSAYAMRAVYLAIAGYLIGFVGRQRAIFEAQLRDVESRAQRLSISRSLHDGYIQALAGVNPRLETCRELLVRNRSEEALAGLQELQLGVAREYDEVRAYIRSLAGIDVENPKQMPSAVTDPRCRVEAEFSARGLLAEHILQIMLEGLRNARRHARARAVDIELRESGGKLRLTIDDDGVGFPIAGTVPWAIASRVAELGGDLSMESHGESACLTIEMPNLR